MLPSNTDNTSSQKPKELQKQIEELKQAASKTISSPEGFAPHYLPSQIEDLTGLIQETDETIETLSGNTYEIGSFARVILSSDVETAPELYNKLLIEYNVSHKNRSQTVVGDQLKKTLEQGYTLSQIRDMLKSTDNPDDVTDSEFVQLLWDLRGKDES